MPPAGMGAGFKCSVGASSSSAAMSTFASSMSFTVGAAREAPKEKALAGGGVEKRLEELGGKNEGVAGAMMQTLQAPS